MPRATGDGGAQGKGFWHTLKHHPVPCSGGQEHYGITAAPAHPTAASTALPSFLQHLERATLDQPNNLSMAGTQGTLPRKRLHTGTNNNCQKAFWDQHQQTQSPQEEERPSGFRRVGTGSEGCKGHQLISPPAPPPVPKQGEAPPANTTHFPTWPSARRFCLPVV